MRAYTPLPKKKSSAASTPQIAKPKSTAPKVLIETDVMTLPEASAYVKLSKQTLIREFRKKTIHAHQFGNRWRVHKDELDRVFRREVISGDAAAAS